MAARKKYDICVKVGEYQQGGEMKPEWRRVGVMMEGDDGREFALLNRDFNPAGVVNPENRSTVLLNMFEPRNDGGQGGGQQPRRQPPANQQGGGYQQQPRQAAPAQAPAKNNPSDDYDDDIPF